MNLTVKVSGTDALALKFKYLIKAAQQGLKFGVAEAADLIAEEAKTLVPVDTGYLHDHIHVETVTDSPERQVAVVSPVNEAANDYGFDPAYARRIEFGFIGTDRLGRTYHQAASPFMRPAYDAKKEEATAAIKEGVFSALDDAMNQVAARRRG